MEDLEGFDDIEYCKRCGNVLPIDSLLWGITYCDNCLEEIELEENHSSKED